MGCTVHVVVSLLLTLAVKCHGQGTCFSLNACGGIATFFASTPGGVEEFCCRYSRAGEPRGISYQPQGIEQCRICPRIFGFFDPEYFGVEQSNPHQLLFGYLSGAPESRPFVAATILITPVTANTPSDFTIASSSGNTVMGTLIGAARVGTLNLQHTIDGVAQENNETYNLTMSSFFNTLDEFQFVDATITVVDSDRVSFFFSEADHSKNENDVADLFIEASLSKNADTRLANDVTFMITPLTIPEAERIGSYIPPAAILANDPDSPYQAIEADFNTSSFTVVFRADEGIAIRTSVTVSVPIVDDDINERFEQLFLITSEVVNAINPDTIDNVERNVTIGIIVDNDALVLGFNQSTLNFDEPDIPETYNIQLIKENNRPTEQRFDVQVNLQFPMGAVGPATPGEDYFLRDFSGGRTTLVSSLAPTESVITFPVTLFPDEIAEGSQGFILETSPFGEPKFTPPSSGNSVQRQVNVVIVDNDPIIIGFEETYYSVNESESTEICVVVTNPPVNQPLSIDSIFLTYTPVRGTAMPTDYSANPLYPFSTSMANMPMSRRICDTTVTGVADGIVENDESVDLFFVYFMPPTTSVILLRPNLTTLEIFDLDVATVGFINTSYTVFESDRNATLLIGVTSGGLGVSITLNVQLLAGSAAASDDYLPALSSSTVVLDGATSQVAITFPIVDDSIFEFTESLSAVLSFAAGGGHPRVTIDPGSAQVNILDDDTLVFGFSASSYDFSEAAGIATVSVALSSGSIGNGIGIALAGQTNDLLIGDRALAGSDYNATIFNTADYSSSITSMPLSIRILQDSLAELTESFSATLTGVASASLSGAPYALTMADTDRIVLNPDETLVNILDDDQAIIGFSPDTYSVVESAGPVSFMFGVLSGQLGLSVDIEFFLVNNTADEGSDFMDTPTSLFSFTDSDRTSVDIVIVDDNIVEREENFFGRLAFLNLANAPSNVRLDPDAAVATVTDNDAATVGFINAPYTVSESDGTATLTIGVISGNLGVPISLDVQLQPGSALASSDYLSTLSSSTVTLDGSTSQVSITFPLVDDSIYEFAESLSGMLSFAAGGGNPRVTIDPNNAQINILDDDTLLLGFSEISYDVSETGGTAAVSMAVLSGTIGTGIGISFSGQTNDLTSGNIALAGSDYNAANFDTAEISASSTSSSISITVLPDSIAELTESFAVLLTGVSSASLSGAPYALTASDINRIMFNPGQTIVNILDDDVATIGFSPDTYSVIEGAEPVRFRFGVISGELGYSVDIQFSLENSTAVEDSDFLDAQDSLFSFNGTAIAFANVDIVDNDILEQEENFFGKLSFFDPVNIPSNVVIGPDTATATIIDNDDVTIGFDPASYAPVAEGGTVSFEIKVLSGTLTNEVEIEFSTSDGSATAPGDYSSTVMTLTFNPEMTSQIVEVKVEEDVLLENAETFFGDLRIPAGSSANVRLEPSRADATIMDINTAVIGFSGNYSVTEGGTVNLVLDVISGTLARAVVIRVTTTDGSAQGPDDYSGINQLVTFAPGQTQVTIPVGAIADGIVEFPEYYTASASLVSTDAAVTISPETAFVNVADSDRVVIGFDPIEYSVLETDGEVILNISVLSGMLARPVEVSYFTIDGTATSSSSVDFIAVSPTPLTFDAGMPFNLVTITIEDDNILENTESFTASLSTLDGAVDINPMTATVDILEQPGDDVVTVGFTPQNYSINEEAGSVGLQIVLLRGTLERDITVQFFTSPGSATESAPMDYQGGTITVTFTPGISSVTQTITIVNDDIVEGPEFFTGNLMGTPGLVMANPDRSFVTINDEADRITVGFDPASYIVNETSGSVELTVRLLDGSLERPAVVNYFTTDGSATSMAPRDFIAQSGALTFQPGIDTLQFSVPIDDDDAVENPESFYANLTSPASESSLILAPNTARVTIQEVPGDDGVIIGFRDTSITVSEDDGQVMVCAELRSPQSNLERDVVVVIQTADGTAIQPEDYVSISAPVTFSSAGPTVMCRNISIVNDDLSEDTQRFVAELGTSDRSVTLNPETADINIEDNDAITIGFELAMDSVLEDAGYIEIIVEVKNMELLQRDVIVNYNTPSSAQNTATVGVDYLAASGALTFSPSDVRLPFNVTIMDDQAAEGLESFMLALETSEDRVSLNPQTMEVEIVDDDVVSIGFIMSPYTGRESDGFVTLSVGVVSGSLNREFVVELTTEDQPVTNAATELVDYQPTSVDLTFNTGISRIDINVTLENDQITENREEFLARLQRVTPGNFAFVGPDSAEVFIEDDDSITIGFAEDVYSVNEADGTVTLMVEVISGSLERPARVSFRTTDGTATSMAPMDFIPVVGSSLVFNSSTTSLPVVVSIVNDAIVENPEFFYGNLSTGDGAVTLAPASARVDILEVPGEDTIRVGFDPASYMVNETQGMATLTLTIIEGMLERPASVLFSTTDGTAISPDDYTAVSSQLVVFDPSTRSMTVGVPIIDDNVVEAREQFNGVLATSDQSVTLSPDVASVFISGFQQGGESVTIGMDVDQVGVPEDVGITMVCASVIRGELQRSAVVTVVYQDRGAINGVDYSGNSVDLTFSQGMQRQCVNVSIINDDNFEVTEEFFVNLTTSDPDVQLMPMFTIVRITDEDTVTIGWEQPRYNISESAGTVELCAMAIVNGVPGAQIQSNIPSVQISLVSGSADPGFDYGSTANPDGFSFTRTSGNRLCTRVTIIDDDNYEMNQENLFADLSLPANPRVTLNPTRTEVVIVDDDVISIGFVREDYSVNENETANLIVEVLDGSLQTNITIRLDTRDGSANSPANEDYEAVSRILTFTPSITSITTRVGITDDTVDEDAENFFADLSVVMGNPDRITVNPDEAMIRIIDNDVVRIGFESPEYQIVEGETPPLEVCASVMAPPTLDKQVVVSVSTVDNTATVGSGDYMRVATNLTFDASNDRSCVPVVVPEDNLVEPTEEFNVILMMLGDEVELSPAVAVVIVNESQKVTVRFGQPSYSFNEGDGTVTISVEKQGDTNLPVMVRVTGGPSTQSDVDNSLPGINEVLTFAPSETRKNITIRIMDDNTAVEPEEMFTAVLEVLNRAVAERGNPGMTTISVTDDDGITIGFGSPNVTLLENDVTFMMCLVVRGDAAVPVNVSLTTQQGTAIAGEDFDPSAIPSSITIPVGATRVCFNSSAVIDDSNQEPTESFMLRLLDTVPSNPNIVFNPVSTTVIILDTDLSGTRVNDTVIGDPLYTLPIRVPQEQLDALNLTKLSLCYEIHGDSGQWFNLVTDNCVSVNTRYTDLTRRLNIMDSVAVRAVDDAGQCVNIRVDVDQCSAMVGSTNLNVMMRYESNGIMVKRYSNRVRITVPNCQDLTLVMWVMCENRSLENPDQPGTMLTSKMIKFVVMRGLNFGSREAHGLLGQFWNVPVSISPYDGLLYDNSPAVGRYVVNITAHGVTRAYTGILHGTTWDHSEGPCLFVGNRQSGPIVEINNPNDPVIQDLYSNYQVKQPFAEDDDFKFGMFEESRCNSFPPMN